MRQLYGVISSITLITMSNYEDDQIPPSVFHRLTYDRKDHDGKEPPRRWGLEELKQSVLEDLSRLLNYCESPLYKQWMAKFKAQDDRFGDPLLAYGLPDFSGAGVNGHINSGFLRAAMEDAIRNCEPRLDKVKVTKVTMEDQGMTARFEIYAELKTHLLVPVSFQTTLSLPTGEYDVRGL